MVSEIFIYLQDRLISYLNKLVNLHKIPVSMVQTTNKPLSFLLVRGLTYWLEYTPISEVPPEPPCWKPNVLTCVIVVVVFIFLLCYVVIVF